MLLYTVFPRNLAAVGFYFKAMFGAAKILGWLDFEGGIHGDRHTRVHSSFNNKPICNCKMRVHIQKLLSTPYHAARFRGRRLLGQIGRQMRLDFEGSGILRCSEISRKYGSCDVATQ